MNKETLKRILSYTKPYKGQMAGAFLSALVQVLLTLLIPVLIGKAIDNIINIGNVRFNEIFKILILIGISLAVSALFQWFMNVFTRKVSCFTARDIRENAFETLNRVPLKFIDSNPHGDLISRLVNDADQVSEGLLQGLTQLFPGIVTILGTIIIMLVLNPFIAMVVVFITPLSIFFAKFITKKTHKYFLKQSREQGELGGYINEMVTGQHIIQSFAYEEECMDAFDEISERLYKSSLKAVFYSSVSNPGTRFVNSLVYAAVCVIGAISAIQGRITIGQVSCFLTYANQYTKPFNEVTSVLTQIQTAFASAGRLFFIIDQKQEPQDALDSKAVTHTQGNVSVEKVDFSYHPQVPLIQNFNLNVKSGQRVAIVGPTGCGKTTMINLLMRFYEVNQGDIQVDGQSIYAMKRNSLRHLYGMVLQETWLKNGTVSENIAYGKPDASQEEIIAAAKAAYAHGFIRRLPKGYETVINDGGKNLSAGQRQLLCIARIMLCHPQMLILDEATSSIDTRTEMLIQKAFEKLMAGHTSFIVAHRLSTIQNADTIIVMDAGHIIEQGNHKELLAKDGFYAKLYNSQFAIE